MKMALPIQATPTLRGKDAIRFLKAMKRREKYGPTKKEKKFLEESNKMFSFKKKVICNKCGNEIIIDK